MRRFQRISASFSFRLEKIRNRQFSSDLMCALWSEYVDVNWTAANASGMEFLLRPMSVEGLLSREALTDEHACAFML
jgi:hypothetical protein